MNNLYSKAIIYLALLLQNLFILESSQMTLKVRISLLGILEELPSCVTELHSILQKLKAHEGTPNDATCVTLGRLIIWVHDGLQNQSIIRSLNPRTLMKDIRVPNSSSTSIQHLWKTEHQKTWALQRGRKLNLVKRVTVFIFCSSYQTIYCIGAKVMVVSKVKNNCKNHNYFCTNLINRHFYK